jgi:hypothetical protein
MYFVSEKLFLWGSLLATLIEAKLPQVIFAEKLPESEP